MTNAPVLTLSVRCIWPFRTVMRGQDLDVVAAWAAHGVDAKRFEHPDTRVPVNAAQQLGRLVVEATGMHDLGLRAALAAEPGLFDLPEYVARCQETISGSLDCLVRIVPLMTDAGNFIRDGQNRFRWEHHPDAPLDRVSIEFLFAYVCLAGARHCADPEAYPDLIQFRHAAPPDIEPYEKLFRRRVQFSAGVDAITYSDRVLALPLKHADSRVGMLLDQVASHLLTQRAEKAKPFSEEVRRLVAKHVADDGAPVSVVAEELGMTPKTLARRLAEESTTYRDLADDVRRGLALAYMDRGDLGVSEITYLLGFSGVQAFHRAFKRWTGLTPGAYRKGVSSPAAP